MHTHFELGVQITIHFMYNCDDKRSSYSNPFSCYAANWYRIIHRLTFIYDDTNLLTMNLVVLYDIQSMFTYM